MTDNDEVVFETDDAPNSSAMADDVAAEINDASTTPIELPTAVASWSDGYWMEVTQYLREEGHIGEDDFLVSATISVTVEENLEITDYESISP